MAEKDAGQQTKGPDAEGGVTGLLEQLSQEQDSGQQEGGEGEGSDPAGEGEQGTPPQPQAVDVDAIVAALEEKLASRFDAVADRRVNAILKEVRGGKTPSAPKAEEKGVQTQTVDPTVDVRSARLSFKEYLSDSGLTFLGTEERAFAMDLGAALVTAGAKDAEDEDVLGREVAVAVAAKVREMRSFYETRTVDALRRRGALKPADGQPPKGPDQVGGSAEWSKGEEIAKQMFGKQ